jgi:hypothetical protein
MNREQCQKMCDALNESGLAGQLIKPMDNSEHQKDCICAGTSGSCSAVVHGKFLPDNPTQFDYLHAIRAVASRIGNKQIFDLADEAMNLPNANVEPPRERKANVQ